MELPGNLDSQAVQGALLLVVLGLLAIFIMLV